MGGQPSKNPVSLYILVWNGWTNQVEEPLSFGGTVSDGVRYITMSLRLGPKKEMTKLTP
jgi:hypothetical protein